MLINAAALFTLIVEHFMDVGRSVCYRVTRLGEISSFGLFFKVPGFFLGEKSFVASILRV
jgi:hypothetical protein